MLRLFGGVFALVAGMPWTTATFACGDKLTLKKFRRVLNTPSNANDYLDTVDDALEIRSRAGSPKK